MCPIKREPSRAFSRISGRILQQKCEGSKKNHLIAMKALNITSIVIFSLALVFNLFHWAGHHALIFFGCLFLFIPAFVSFFKHMKTNLPRSLLYLSFAFSLFYIFKKITFDLFPCLLLLCFISVLTIFFYNTWQENSINNLSRRNEHWSWFVAKNTGKGSWVPVGDKMTLQSGDYTLFYSTGEII